MISRVISPVHDHGNAFELFGDDYDDGVVGRVDEPFEHLDDYADDNADIPNLRQLTGLAVYPPRLAVTPEMMSVTPTTNTSRPAASSIEFVSS